MNTLRNFWSDESGQGVPEYALLVAAVVVMVIAVSAIFTPALQQVFRDLGTRITAAQATIG